MLHIIFDCSIFAVLGKQRATLGSDPDDTNAVCMRRLSNIDNLLFVYKVLTIKDLCL